MLVALERAQGAEAEVHPEVEQRAVKTEGAEWAARLPVSRVRRVRRKEQARRAAAIARRAAL